MLALLVVAALNAATLPEPQTVWEHSFKGAISAPMTFYPSAEEPSGLLVSCESGTMALLDGQGQIVWSCELGGNGESSPAVAELDGVGPPEIVVATGTGNVLALTSTGDILWQHALDGRVREWRGPCAADLDRDGKSEILIGDDAGWLTCLGPTGKRMWRIYLDPYRISSPGVADVDGDGTPEIFVGTENNRIACIDAAGRLRWSATHDGQFGRTAPTLGDIDGDRRYEVLVQTSFNNVKPRLIALNAEDGSEAWVAPVQLQGYAAIGLADLEGDGSLEVLVGNRSNIIYCFNGDGTERWATLTGGQSYLWAPSVADVNGDGRCEIIGGVRAANDRGQSWFVLDDAGALLGEYPLPGGSNTAPMVADINRDGAMDIFLIGTEQGLVRCVTFGGLSEGARRPWAQTRRDSARTGAVPVADQEPAAGAHDVPARLEVQLNGPAVWGENQVKMTWPSGIQDGTLCEVSVKDPRGRTESRLYPFEAGALPDTLPVEFIEAGNHRLSIVLRRSAGPTILGAAELDVSLGGFDTLASVSVESIASIGATAKTLVDKAPLTARLLDECKARQQAALDTLAGRAAQVAFDDVHVADAFLRDIRTFRSDLNSAVALAKAAEAVQSVRPESVLAAWEDPNPWDDAPALMTSFSPAEKPVLTIAAYGGEYESRAVHLLNLAPEPLTVQVRPDAAALDVVTTYEVIDVPRKDGKRVNDALADMGKARTLRLAPGEARTLWLTVNAGDLTPGTQDLGIKLLPLGYEASALDLDVQLEVLPLSLNDAPVFRVCNWSSPQRQRKSGGDANAAIRDAQEHGVNVFVLGMPPRKADRDGNLIGAADWSGLDADLALLGPQCFALFGGRGIAAPEGTEEFGDVHLKAQRAWLTEFADHMASRGWGKDRWALYPFDEPGLYGGTEVLTRIARHLKSAMPDVPIYANPSGGVTLTNFEPMANDIDVWCPEQQLLRRRPDLAEYFVNKGKPVWSYEAPGEVKTLYPLGYYRANAWMAFQLGLSGCGFWIQTYGVDNDLWLTQDREEWGANYVSPGGEVISRRWEAWRDGSEDARAFMRLKVAMQKAETAGTHADARARVAKLMGDMKTATAKAWVTNDITRFLINYDLDYGEVQRIRRETADLTQILEQP